MKLSLMKNNKKIILESFELINFYFKMKNSIILTALVCFVKQTASNLLYILIILTTEVFIHNIQFQK